MTIHEALAIIKEKTGKDYSLRWLQTLCKRGQFPAKRIPLDPLDPYGKYKWEIKEIPKAFLVIDRKGGKRPGSWKRESFYVVPEGRRKMLYYSYKIFKNKPFEIRKSIAIRDLIQEVEECRRLRDEHIVKYEKQEYKAERRRARAARDRRRAEAKARESAM